ncbi:CHAT domain-containing protein [Actinoplanes sp. NPDC051851]|uniref:CHAT domain-containing protein n=1 Tax=Actinoplanes sp. NPDC051851 TaxID=3154753 RepID=UPI00341C9B3C
MVDRIDCLQARLRLLESAGTAEDIGECLSFLESLPENHPEQGDLAQTIVTVIIWKFFTGGQFHWRELDRLIDIGDRCPENEEWESLRSSARLIIEGGGTLPASQKALQPLMDHILDHFPDAADDPNAQVSRLFQELQQADQSDAAMLLGIEARMTEIERESGDALSDATINLIAAARNWLSTRFTLPESASAMEAFRDTMGRALSSAGAPEQVRESLNRILDEPGSPESLELLGTLGVASSEQAAELFGPEDYTHIGPGLAALRLHLQGGSPVEALDAEIDHLRTALATAAAKPAWHASEDHVFALLNMGNLYWERYRVSGERRDLRGAERILLDARRMAGRAESRHWPDICIGLSLVQYALGARRQAYQSHLDALLHYPLGALLQSGARAIRATTRSAAEHALDAVRWILSGDEESDSVAAERAVAALEAGRALVLFEAVALGDAEARLRAAGRPDLADQWHRAQTENPDVIPTSLRREIVSVLHPEVGEAHSGHAGVPDVPAIQAALRRLDIDALVYLIPAGDGMPGKAVTVPAQGSCHHIDLPELVMEEPAGAWRHLSAWQARGERPADPGRDLAAVRAATDVDQICGWAWRAAVGPLLDQAVTDLPPHPPGRVPRLVLIPTGALALVPWSAARRADGVHAVQLACFTQIPSARMLCRSAEASRMPVRRTGPVAGGPGSGDPGLSALVVGDPDTGESGIGPLGFAGIEASAIESVFYPGARILGRVPGSAGPGTAADVLDWIDDPARKGGETLHLACHAMVGGPDGGLSHLVLAERQRLTAGQLTTHMMRTADRPLELVVLAACNSGVSIHGYDEAYSLGTAFLAGGVRSVLSAQWSISDRSTSVLMFMFHYFRRAGENHPGRALRQAQMWMLDPLRRVPESMPPELRRPASDGGLERVEAWAGFTAWGC